MNGYKKLDKRKSTITAFPYTFIGLQLAITVLIFVFGGYKLDNYLNKSPLFIIIGSFLGMALGFYNLIRQLQQIDKREKTDQNRKRNRWM